MNDLGALHGISQNIAWLIAAGIHWTQRGQYAPKIEPLPEREIAPKPVYRKLAFTRIHKALPTLKGGAELNITLCEPKKMSKKNFVERRLYE